ncbi:MAG: hypothetical protein GTO63_19925, partial [Anaerolineae bacterium]|nr:hypothetical protein [Anaerolineae bacterium]NIN97047.1 hypothetical protein [Anaerolineae bacterium]NIQ79995.1 hypothetical protein [Anaerolineae bacterium]
TSSQLAQLIKCGHQQGHIALEESLVHFPELSSGDQMLEELQASLQSAGVAFVDKFIDSDQSPGQGAVEEDDLEEEVHPQGEAAGD